MLMPLLLSLRLMLMLKMLCLCHWSCHICWGSHSTSCFYSYGSCSNCRSCYFSHHFSWYYAILLLFLKLLLSMLVLLMWLLLLVLVVLQPLLLPSSASSQMSLNQSRGTFSRFNRRWQPVQSIHFPDPRVLELSRRGGRCWLLWSLISNSASPGS